MCNFIVKQLACHLPLTLLLSGVTLGDDYEQAPFHYSDSVSADPVEKMRQQIESGDLKLPYTDDKTFLHDFLKRMNVPVESQVMVFSRTSLQTDRISPTRPRPVYFSDNCYVGWVQGGEIEITSVDATLGPVFYRMRIPRQSDSKPRIIRDRNCLNCHGSSRTRGYPGLLVRSVYTDANGFPILGAGTFRTEHSSPLSERWGGWYVTGQNAGDRHMGNRIHREAGESGQVEIASDFGTSLTDLKEVIDTTPYLSAESDIVALMVLEHQVTAHNAITRAHYDTRKWLYNNRIMAEQFGQASGSLSDSTRRLIDRQADELLKVMMFADETPLEGWGVEGGEAFQEAFLKNAKKAESGRSLRDFELLSRLFRHRMSYMIYSDSFVALPKELTDVFFKKLKVILYGQPGGETDPYDYLSKKERGRILDILKDTTDYPLEP